MNITQYIIRLWLAALFLFYLSPTGVSANPTLNEALCHAASSGTPAEIRVLARKGASLNGKCKDWSASPLDNAVQANKLANMKALLDAGADVNAISADFNSAIFWARTAPQAKILIDRHANVNIRSLISDEIGQTPLIDLSAKITMAYDDEDATNYEAMALLLIDAGADVNAITPDGETALHGCVVEHGKACVTALLDHGANPNPPRNDLLRSPLAQAIYMQGSTAQGLSQALGQKLNTQAFREIEALLRAHGAVE